jgi:hypothetical protein
MNQMKISWDLTREVTHSNSSDKNSTVGELFHNQIRVNLLIFVAKQLLIKIFEEWKNLFSNYWILLKIDIKFWLKNTNWT